MRARPLLLLLLLGCTGTPVGPSAGWLRDLGDARDRWAAAAIRDYDYTWQRSCFCVPLVLRITVRGGVVTAIHDVEADTAHVAPLADLRIEALFDSVAAYIGRDPDDLTAEYDATTGAPRSVAVDPIREAADEEGGFLVREFARH